MRIEKQFAGSAKRTPKTLSAIHETTLLRDGFSNSGSDELITISVRTRLWITDLDTKGKNMEFLCSLILPCTPYLGLLDYEAEI